MNIGIINKGITQLEEEKLMTAIHESGHALAGLLNKNSIKMEKVTILSKGGSLGHTSFVPERDIFLMKRKNLEALMDVSMGGRVAEELFYGNDSISTGCGSDLQNATRQAFSFVAQEGFGSLLLL